MRLLTYIFHVESLASVRCCLDLFVYWWRVQLTSVEKTVVFYSNSAVTVFIFWPPYTNTADVKLKDVIDVQTFKKKKEFSQKIGIYCL